MEKSDYLAEILKTRIRYEEWPDGGNLPPVRHIAQEWETTVPTVLKALGKLLKGGWVGQTGSGRYFAVDSRRRYPSTDTRALSCRTRDEEIADTLKREVLSGAYRHGASFPSVKTLRERFACSHPTIRRALQRLQHEGQLEKAGKRYRPRAAAPGPDARAQVVLTGPSGLVHAVHTQRYLFIYALEREIQARGWGQLCLFLADDPSGDKPPPDHLVAALIHFGHQHLSSNWIEFFRNRPNIPLVVVDHSEMLRWDHTHNSRRFWILPDNRQAGRDVAGTLHALGHRNVAVFYHVPLSERWAKLRVDGVRDVFGAGEECSVKVFRRPRQQREHRLIPLTRQINQLRNTFDAAGFVSPRCSKDRIDRLYDMRGLWLLGLEMAPHFEEALADRDITAWICVNDDLASVAHSFLSDHGKRIGRDISLAGFDNSPISYSMMIASYDFAFDRMGHMAISCLESPSAVPVDPSGYVRIHGQAILRQSVGPCQ